MTVLLTCSIFSNFLVLVCNNFSQNKEMGPVVEKPLIIFPILLESLCVILKYSYYAQIPPLPNVTKNTWTYR